jgi:hypothetical protein
MLNKKLRLREHLELVVLHGPQNYKELIAPLPAGLKVKTRLGKSHDFIHLFVKNKSVLEKEIRAVLNALNPGALLWISYPKSSSGIQTDLSRDTGWECLANCKLRWMSMISFDNCWSAFLLKNEQTPAETKASKAIKELASSYFNAQAKTVRVPDDLSSVLKKSSKALLFFNALSYSCRKEYVVWIVTAKQNTTRQSRVLKTVEKLLEGKKNPTQK